MVSQGIRLLLSAIKKYAATCRVYALKFGNIKGDNPSAICLTAYNRRIVPFALLLNYPVQTFGFRCLNVFLYIQYFKGGAFVSELEYNNVTFFHFTGGFGHAAIEQNSFIGGKVFGNSASLDDTRYF
jgi:hypothetical protein